MVEPVRSRLVTAPRITGGGLAGTAPAPAPPLVIVRLARAGTAVRRGDLLVEFDRTAQQKNARDREAEYLDILAQIEKKRPEQIIARAARQTGLKLAENAVRRAELDLVGVEMLAKITAEKTSRPSKKPARNWPSSARRTSSTSAPPSQTCACSRFNATARRTPGITP